MLVVDYQSKSYHRFLEDMTQIAKHKTRFLVTFNGPNPNELTMAEEDFLSATKNKIQHSTVVSDKGSETLVSELFSAARINRDMLLFENTDLLFDKKTEVKKSHERDSGFDINHLFKSIAKHNGVVILATQNKQTLSSTMSTKVDVLVRFPSA
ncbi:hypothetical protein GCM10007916_34550 [Psychromonas marina]|uniref:ATPase AAA-type core domain-containing protein n=1 Tax=Psychromonas marina TaxID=88364 RepID=A0ABQ6E4Q8_9GAMM|nr:hypothetical protein [Psychromonas marina]GLS92384.1 hypothetical protein GCM10007916_34550 [Psychromonas marina]